MVGSKTTETGGRELIFSFIVKIMSSWTACFGSLCCFVKIRLSVFSSPNPQSFSICYRAVWSWVLGLQWPGPPVKLESSGEVRGCKCLLQGAVGVADWAGWWGEVPKGGSPESSGLAGEERALPSSLPPAVSALRHYIFRSNYFTLLLGNESFLNLPWNNPAKEKKKKSWGRGQYRWEKTGKCLIILEAGWRSSEDSGHY